MIVIITLDRLCLSTGSRSGHHSIRPIPLQPGNNKPEILQGVFQDPEFSKPKGDKMDNAFVFECLRKA